MQEQLGRLRDMALRHCSPGKMATPIPRLAIHMGQVRTALSPALCEPMLCLVLQGAKTVTIGDRVLRYDPASYFVATVDLPVSGCIIEASVDHPYIGLSMRLDRDCLTGLIAELPDPGDAPAPGFAVSAVTPQLLDPWLRLLSLLDEPRDLPVLAPMLEREILYRVLQGPQGGMIRQAAIADSRLSRVRRAIGWIRANFDRPLRVEMLAELAGMSPASFHRHFKTATAMSPLQYQKSMRLQEARRLLIANAEASRAGYAVGYESASQFSREYARMFGTPPARDAERLRRQGPGETVANLLSASFGKPLPG
ncbi:AraC family transcriptional regulator [Sphingomonas colocasiae]|uniref:AraC family transcriptional regulator n=1 Tax=Sphingomonas colocasiae TaxID=1848973 RepID=A0ABS7PVH4_9SPHN|nr:AraC family transcriptional regulator [Sphingomonas colocasiae]MBY8825352.1 AraC family transcriptional regulator [Sphingomonas colocasiae]